MNVNKAGQDWLVLRAKLGTMIGDAHAMMERGLTIEEYHHARGQIDMARSLIEWVEPTTPPITNEDNYGISDPSE